MRESPVWIAWLANATARRPEPQTWLTPQAGTSFGTPAAIDACRAGFWPWAAVSTWPRITSETSSGATPACASAASMATRPSSWAGVLPKAPRNEPTGVRLAAVMTTSVMNRVSEGNGVGGRLAFCCSAGKPGGQRLPELLPAARANHHADMAEVEIQPLATGDRGGLGDDAVGGGDDAEQRHGERGGIDDRPADPPASRPR